MKYSKFIALAAFALPMVAFAQTEITFENQDYKSLGVYDTWEASPFRTGKLSGNYAVIDNHLQYVDEQLGVAPGDVHKYTIVIWLEGYDPDCTNELIGGHLGFEMNMSLIDDTKK